MKNLLNSLCCVLIFISMYACSGGSASKSPGTVLTGFTQIPIAGGKGTKAVKKDAAGKVIEEGVLVNGKKNGTWITYYENQEDRIKTLANYVDDQLNGLFLTFSNRGQIETQTGYTNGTYDGVYTKYRFGNVEETATYENGEMQGVYKQFYNNNKIKLEANYKNGKQHGAYKYYDEEGKVLMEYEYNNGEKVSGGITEK